MFFLLFAEGGGLIIISVELTDIGDLFSGPTSRSSKSCQKTCKSDCNLVEARLKRGFDL